MTDIYETRVVVVMVPTGAGFDTVDQIGNALPVGSGVGIIGHTLPMKVAEPLVYQLAQVGTAITQLTGVIDKWRFAQARVRQLNTMPDVEPVVYAEAVERSVRYGITVAETIDRLLNVDELMGVVDQERNT